MAICLHNSISIAAEIHKDAVMIESTIIPPTRRQNKRKSYTLTWLAISILSIASHVNFNFLVAADRLETKTKAHAQQQVQAASTARSTTQSTASSKAGSQAATSSQAASSLEIAAQSLSATTAGAKFDPTQDSYGTNREGPASHPYSNFADDGFHEQLILFLMVIIFLCILACWYKDYVLDVWWLLTDNGEKQAADHRVEENDYQYSHVPMTDPEHWSAGQRARNRRPSADGRMV